MPSALIHPRQQIWQNADSNTRTGRRVNEFILSASSALHKVTIDPGLRQAEAESVAWPGGESGLMKRRLTSHSPMVLAQRRPPIFKWSDSFRCFHVTGLIAVGLRWQTTLRGFPLETRVQVEGKDLGQSVAKWQILKQNKVLPSPSSIYLHVTRHIGWNCFPESSQMSMSLRAHINCF